MSTTTQNPTPKPETSAGPDCALPTGSRLPRRRVVLEMKIGADTRERMLEELEDITRRLRSGNMWGDCAMGGHSAGYTVSATEDESITHETYFAALDLMHSANTGSQGRP